MSHEDFYDISEPVGKTAEPQTAEPLRGTSAPPIWSRSEGFITVDIPPLTIPTPAKAAKYLATSPTVQVALYLLIGIAVGYFWNDTPKTATAPPVIPATETLESFVARESQVLTADERKKLMAIAETILTGNFETPSALREEFHYQRMKAKLHDSPGFNAFWDKFAARVQGTADDKIESTRSVYESLLHGLKAHNDFSGMPVEGIFSRVSPSITTPLATDGGEPVSPGISERATQRIFRRR